jgi:hypothetical protein
MLVFGKTEPEDGGGICHGEEAVLCRADNGGDEAGRGGCAGGAADLEDRDSEQTIYRWKKQYVYRDRRSYRAASCGTTLANR